MHNICLVAFGDLGWTQWFAWFIKYSVSGKKSIASQELRETFIAFSKNAVVIVSESFWQIVKCFHCTLYLTLLFISFFFLFSRGTFFQQLTLRRAPRVRYFFYAHGIRYFSCKEVYIRSCSLDLKLIDFVFCARQTVVSTTVLFIDSVVQDSFCCGARLLEFSKCWPLLPQIFQHMSHPSWRECLWSLQPLCTESRNGRNISRFCARRLKWSELS